MRQRDFAIARALPEEHTRTTLRILAMTLCVMDVFPGSGRKCPGGNALNFAVQARRSGFEQVSLLGAVGHDESGRTIRRVLTDHRVEVSHLHQLPGRTASHRVLISETGERIFLPENWDGGVYETFRLSESDWRFVGGFDAIAMIAIDPNYPALFEHRRSDQKIFVDFLDRAGPDEIATAMDQVDVAMVSGTRSIAETLLPETHGSDSVVLVTLGAEGSLALHRGVLHEQPAARVEEVVDTTGCGDAYAGAFMASWMVDGDIARAMSRAAEAASRVLTHVGAI